MSICALILAMMSGAAVSADRGGWMYAPCDRGEKAPDACIARLLSQYPGDGGASLELGPQLCKALVAQPKTFFALASAHRREFDEWLSGLPDSTFTVLESANSVEAELQVAYLVKLRDLMLTVLRNYPKNAPNYDLATQVASRIARLEISKGN